MRGQKNGRGESSTAAERWIVLPARTFVVSAALLLRLHMLLGLRAFLHLLLRTSLLLLGCLPLLLDLLLADLLLLSGLLLLHLLLARLLHLLLLSCLLGL
jgi:hypothetical protein